MDVPDSFGDVSSEANRASAATLNKKLQEKLLESEQLGEDDSEEGRLRGEGGEEGREGRSRRRRWKRRRRRRQALSIAKKRRWWACGVRRLHLCAHHPNASITRMCSCEVACARACASGATPNRGARTFRFRGDRPHRQRAAQLVAELTDERYHAPMHSLVLSFRNIRSCLLFFRGLFQGFVWHLLQCTKRGCRRTARRFRSPKPVSRVDALERDRVYLNGCRSGHQGR